jgi:hypothetical protein
MEQLLQQILETLQQKQTLGFCPPPIRRRIYCNLQYSTPMYFWDGANKEAIPTPESAIACMVEAINIEAGEHRGKPNNKVVIDIQADAPYRLVIGVDTLTVKSLLLGLIQADLNRPVTFAFRSGDEENALFCDVIQGDRLKSDRQLKQIPEAEVLDLAYQIQSRLSMESSDDADPPQTEAPMMADPITGQGEIIPSEGAIADQLNAVIQSMNDPFEALAVRRDIESRRVTMGEAIYAGVMARYHTKDVGLDYVGAIGRLVRDLGWSSDQARQWLHDTHGVRSRSEMNPVQLRKCFADLYELWNVQASRAA